MGTLDVGATLRDERLRRQLSLDEISRQTKISARFLKAIESDDFGALPGIVFMRNFVRQYATLLDLDARPLLQALPSYDLETAPMPAAPARSQSRSWDPRWNSALASIAWTVLACGAAVAAYVHFNRPVPPQEVQAAQVQTSQVQPARADTRPADPAPPADAAPVAAQSADAPPPQPATDKAVENAKAVDNLPVRVVITARQDSWVQMTADGKTAFIGTLKANESRTVASDGPVKVRTGNAGGIDITLNGKPVESLGPQGQIRSVTLTAEGPRYAPKSPPASPDPV